MARFGRIAAVTAVGAGLAAAGAAVLTRRRSGPPLEIEFGMFPNTMAYGKVVGGPKSVLVLPGGPGNSAPTERWMRASTGWYRPFVDAGYSLWQVARKRGMPRGHTMADIADDHAALIADEFGGRVDLVVGTSYGGAITLELAARHPECAGGFVVVAAAARVNDAGRAADLEFARHLSEGRPGAAMAAFAPFVVPGVPAPVARAIGRIVGPLALRDSHATFRSDTLVEAEAEAGFDATDLLPTISAPVLVIAGDADAYFPVEYVEATAAGIPKATLRMYPGAGHMKVASTSQASRDILDWVAGRPFEELPAKG